LVFSSFLRAVLRASLSFFSMGPICALMGPTTVAHFSLAILRSGMSALSEFWKRSDVAAISSNDWPTLARNSA
jgi:hypothetical protein